MAHNYGRRLNKQSKGKSTRYGYSYKSGRHLWLDDSKLESHFLLDFEFRDEVHRIVSQPIRLQYPDLDTGELLGYTPDFALIGIGVDDYIEIKLSRFAKGEAFEHLMACVRTHLWNTQKRTLGVITENDIAKGDRLENYKLLIGYKRIQPLHSISLLTLKKSIGNQTTMAGLVDYLAQRQLPPTYAYALVAHKLVDCNFDELITDQTEVFFR
ncbi:hypothetical protein GCM10011369_18930 [Neiella marina]|uniref:TnsA endonuclease N-terminal domain-containing protein n=1 Tax=Neiella marina TaxID=508461 RepID=A0A8J2XP03_9GAMM|nr:hypothetical protein [Neiella marina]GGA77282.1 hypothetical protein GCM10011369_18930 [Neiella marina]